MARFIYCAVAFCALLALPGKVLGQNVAGYDIDASQTPEWWQGNGFVTNLPYLDGDGKFQNAKTIGYTANKADNDNPYKKEHCDDSKGDPHAHVHFRDDYSDEDPNFQLKTMGNNYWDSVYNVANFTNIKRIADCSNSGNCHTHAMNSLKSAAVYKFWIGDPDGVYGADTDSQNVVDTTAGDLLYYKTTWFNFEHSTIVTSVFVNAPTELEWKNTNSGVYVYSSPCSGTGFNTPGYAFLCAEGLIWEPSNWQWDACGNESDFRNEGKVQRKKDPPL